MESISIINNLSGKKHVKNEMKIAEMIKMKSHLKRIIKIFFSPITRIGLKNRNFTIISNNCWGGHYYDKYHLPYMTPTIGLFIPPKDFVKFINNLEFYLSKDVENIDVSTSKVLPVLERKIQNHLMNGLDNVFIGKIYDIELVFIHYKSFDDARVKWNRRKKRVNYSNIIIKFNDQNEFKEEDFDGFINCPYKNKVFFTSNCRYKGRPNVFYVKKI